MQENELLKIIKEHLETEVTRGLVVDVGASGFYSPASLLVQEGYSGILFEPHPKSFKELQEKYKDREDVIVVNRAISNQSGVLDFLLHPNPTLSSLAKNSTWYKEETKIETIKIEVCLLSDELDRLNVPKNFAFLKIDAEGFDYRILENILGISEYRPLVIEHEIQHPGPMEFKKLLSKYNYACFYDHSELYGPRSGGNMLYRRNNE
jgi:FkbM family methyltransferase